MEDRPEQAGILIAINSGIRIGELCALQWKDVDLDRGILHVSKTMQRIKTYTEEITETEIRIMRPKSVCPFLCLNPPDKYPPRTEAGGFLQSFCNLHMSKLYIPFSFSDRLFSDKKF